LRGITVNLLFYKVFLKHIGCTPSLSDPSRSISFGDRAVCGLLRQFVTYRCATSLGAALSPMANTSLSGCVRMQVTLIQRRQARNWTALWRDALARFESNVSARLRWQSPDLRAA
jgi:hypothetical protein